MCLSSCFSKEVLPCEVEKAKAGAYISGIILRYMQKIIFMFEAQEPTEAYILSGSLNASINLFGILAHCSLKLLP